MSPSDAELTCRELVELVTDYLEARLTPAARRRFEAHLADCDGCVAHLEQLRQTIRVVGRAREGDVAEPARRALLEAFRGWKK
jgi:anti-sigma factor RsiW